ncbi:MAG: menaquinone reductase molybdopterin-binding-like subunit QrcB [Desulfosalsimonadaceae bacterium]
MKIDRRSFLTYTTAAVLGGAAGTMLTPAPWKLMDDAAIWTQNWPWTPVPETGPVTYKKSTCTLCPGGCGINVRFVGSRPVKIEGLKDHPVNKGALCPMGLSGLQYVYGPDRVRSPLKRKGKRGEGKWEKITWDEALAAVAEKLASLRQSENPQSVACITGREQGTLSSLIGRFLTVYGSPNLIPQATAQDAGVQAVFLTQGKIGTPGFDIENADFILSFGSGILDGWGSPARMSRLYGTRNPAQKFIQIEPRLSNTAAGANRWIGINPGTEGALALGLAHVIIKESLYSKNFIEKFTFGFNDWTDAAGVAHTGFATMADAYAPEKVSRITGIPKALIEALAREFAGSSRPLAINGRGQGSLPGSIDETLAVHSLNALTGNINQIGGLSVIPEPTYAKWPDLAMDATASKGMQQPRFDGAGSESFPNSRSLLNRVPGLINGATGDSPIQALLVVEANPMYTLPDTAATRKAFDRIPFIVSFSCYMDETAAYADYILPNHSPFERYQDVPTPAGMSHQAISLATPVIEPRYDTKHTGDAFIRIAKTLGGFIGEAFPWDDYAAFLEDTLHDQWDGLKEKGVVEIASDPAASEGFSFNTASAKYEFYPAARAGIGKKDTDVLPAYTPAAIEGDEKRFSLLLIPYDSMRLAGDQTANSPFMTKTVDDTVLKKQMVLVEINPTTGKKLNLKEGDTAQLVTPRGKAEVIIHLYEGIMPGLIAMPRGLGHTAYSEYLADKGANINALMGPVEDPASGLDTAWGIRARLSKA